MRINLNRKILMFLLVLLIDSCTIKKVTIQVADPPILEISPDIKSIALLNRSLNELFTNLLPDDPVDLVNNLNKNERFYDSSASDSSLISAARAIFSSQRFDVIVPYESDIWRNDRKDMLEPLDTSVVNDICKNFNVDAALVLENFNQKANGRFTMEWIRAMGNVVVISDLKWRFYQPRKEPLNFTVHDQVNWYGGLDKTRKEGFRQLPPLKNMLVIAGLLAGEQINGQITPRWNDQQRVYYCMTHKNQIGPLIESGKWEEVLEIWSKYISSHSTSKNYKIAFNMALAYEMTGNPDRAVEWIKKSYQIKPSKRSKNYLEYLMKRQTMLVKK